MSQDQQNQNDIDQILNEVEELRRELNTEAESVDTQTVAEEIASHLSPESSKAAVATLPAAAAPVPAPSPTLAQATEVAKELAAIVDSSMESTTAVAAAAPVATPMASVENDDLMKEFHASLGSGDDAGESLESTLAELKDDPSVKTLLDQTFDDQARRQQETVVAHVPPQKESPPMTNNDDGESSPSLTMSLTGSMTLRLKYEFAGQEVTVGFTDEYLKVELADGTEFKIPVGRQKTLRRVA